MFRVSRLGEEGTAPASRAEERAESQALILAL